MPTRRQMRWVARFDHVELEKPTPIAGQSSWWSELAPEMPLQLNRGARGFVLSADAFREHLLQGGIGEYIYASLDAVDVTDADQLTKLSAAVRHLIQGATLPKEMRCELALAYRELSLSAGEAETDVTVRAFCTAGEEVPGGAESSDVHVRGVAALLEAARDCMASLFTAHAIAARAAHGLEHRKVGLTIRVEKPASGTWLRLGSAPATAKATPSSPAAAMTANERAHDGSAAASGARRREG